MEGILENLKVHNHAASRLEAVKTLANLLLHEIESLSEVSHLSGDRLVEHNTNLNDKVQSYEVGLICNALLESHGNQTKAAKMLGMKNSTLHAKIRRYEI